MRRLCLIWNILTTIPLAQRCSPGLECRARALTRRATPGISSLLPRSGRIGFKTLKDLQQATLLIEHLLEADVRHLAECFRQFAKSGWRSRKLSD